MAKLIEHFNSMDIIMTAAAKAKHHAAPEGPKLTDEQIKLRDQFHTMEIEIKKATGNAMPDALSFQIAKLKDMMGLPAAPSPEVHI